MEPFLATYCCLCTRMHTTVKALASNRTLKRMDLQNNHIDCFRPSLDLAKAGSLIEMDSAEDGTELDCVSVIEALGYGELCFGVERFKSDQ